MGTRWELAELGLEHFRQVDVPTREPGPGEVRLRIRAIALNYRDLLMVRGHYDPRVPRPLVPCSDAVGVVEATGPDTRASVGERRMPVFAQGWLDGSPRAEHLKTTLGGPLPGTLQSHLIVPEAATVRVPDGLDDHEAATLPCAGVTAWHALQQARITAGSTVLTLGTGGVSIFALQLAKALGAHVAITSRSEDKLARARALGADLTVNYATEPRWGRVVAAWREADAVIEVGGVGTLEQSIRATRVGGTVALIGVLAKPAPVDLTRALMRSIRIQGILVGSAAHLQSLCGAIEATGLRPVVDRVFDFDEAPAAFAHLASGSHLGKVVIRGAQAVSSRP